MVPFFVWVLGGWGRILFFLRIFLKISVAYWSDFDPFTYTVSYKLNKTTLTTEVSCLVRKFETRPHTFLVSCQLGTFNKIHFLPIAWRKPSATEHSSKRWVHDSFSIVGNTSQFPKHLQSWISSLLQKKIWKKQHFFHQLFATTPTKKKWKKIQLLKDIQESSSYFFEILCFLVVFFTHPHCHYHISQPNKWVDTGCTFFSRIFFNLKCFQHGMHWSYFTNFSSH